MTSSPEPSGRSAVLYLSAKVAEWVERGPDGSYRHGRAPSSGLAPGDLARAAEAALEAAGGRQRACVLALGDGLVGLRPLVLPPLPRAEAHRVLLRKAAALLECDPADALYRTLASQSAESEGRGEALFLVALRRSLVTALRLALRRRGFLVQRVTSAALAPIERARAELAQTEAPCIAVVVGPSSAGVSLSAGACLLNHDVLEGDLLEVPALAASLVQAVRTGAGYWRKLRRGELVEDVVVIGMPPERGQLLGHALEAALPGARVAVLSGESGEPTASRAFAVAACRSEGPLAPDLTSRIPGKKPVTAACLCMLIGVVLGLSGLAYRHLDSTRRVVSSETLRLEAESRDLAALEDHNRAALGALEALRAKVERARSAAASGVDYQDVMAEVLIALSGRAELLSLSVGPSIGGEHELLLRAEMSPDPVRSTAALRAIEDELRAGRWLEDVAVDLPSGLSSRSGGGERDGALEFTVEARVEE